MEENYKDEQQPSKIRLLDTREFHCHIIDETHIESDNGNIYECEQNLEHYLVNIEDKAYIRFLNKFISIDGVYYQMTEETDKDGINRLITINVNDHEFKHVITIYSEDTVPFPTDLMEQRSYYEPYVPDKFKIEEMKHFNGVYRLWPDDDHIIDDVDIPDTYMTGLTKKEIIIDDLNIIITPYEIFYPLLNINDSIYIPFVNVYLKTHRVINMDTYEEEDEETDITLNGLNIVISASIPKLNSDIEEQLDSCLMGGINDETRIKIKSIFNYLMSDKSTFDDEYYLLKYIAEDADIFKLLIKCYICTDTFNRLLDVITSKDDKEFIETFKSCLPLNKEDGLDDKQKDYIMNSLRECDALSSEFDGPYFEDILPDDSD